VLAAIGLRLIAFGAWLMSRASLSPVIVTLDFYDNIADALPAVTIRRDFSA
jgi:hypothetical protein